MRNKNKKTNVRFLATALIGVVVFLLNAGVAGAQEEMTVPDAALSECLNKAEKTYETDKEECYKLDAKCAAIFDRAKNLKCEDDAEIETQQCLLTAELNGTDNFNKCKEESIKNADCGDGKVTGNEECDDSEGKLTEKEDRGDGCFRCKKEDVFRVADVLKIDEGQSYLEKSSGSDSANSTSLKKGLVFLVIQFIELLTKIIGSLALLMIIAGGLILMISSGNSQLQQKGKRIIMYAILGLVIAFLSLVIVTTIQSLFYTT